MPSPDSAYGFVFLFLFTFLNQTPSIAAEFLPCVEQKIHNEGNSISPDVGHAEDMQKYVTRQLYSEVACKTNDESQAVTTGSSLEKTSCKAEGLETAPAEPSARS